MSISFTLTGVEDGTLIGRPIKISWGERPVFLLGVERITISAKGIASGHLMLVCMQILASSSKFHCGILPLLQIGGGTGNADVG